VNELGARARALQTTLEDFYALERAPDVRAFLRAVDDDEREQLLLREGDDELELVVLVPESARDAVTGSDAFFQLVEGVSHFVYVAERARTELGTTLLELELQAEVDKFVVIALSVEAPSRAELRHWCEAIYVPARYLHAESSEDGARYRRANALAARFVGRLLAAVPRAAWRGELRRFHRAGQSEKLSLARAA
jgi:hypothetical protein